MYEGLSVNFLGLVESPRLSLELEGDLAAGGWIAYDALILSQIFTYIKRGEKQNEVRNR